MSPEEPTDERRQTIAITGSTGMIGTQLRDFLTDRGHDIIQVVRSRPTADGEVYWSPRDGEIDIEGLEGADAVVHLAGENIFGRWTESKKTKIMESRREGTELISEAIADLDDSPDVLVASSAVGYYGDRGDEVVDESSESGEGFLAEVCREWEAATEPAAGAGIRTVNLRTGLVLSSTGGALGMMLTPFKLGLGGRIGSGEQYMSWIDIEDLIRIADFAIHDDQLEGPVNTVAPNPVRNEEFTEVLGDVLNRPTFLPVPGFAAKMAFGQMADETLLSGQRVEPAKLKDRGFEWNYPHLEEALRHQLE